MKTLTIKNIFLAITLSLVSMAAQAGNGEKKPIISKMEFAIINASTVEISTNMYVNAKETLEIQRSYDNKNFQTVAVIFGEEEKGAEQSFKLKDKVKKNSEVYYRVVRVQNGVVTPLTGSALVSL